MKKIIWSEEAIEDLRRIYNYYFYRNPQVAAGIYKRIRSDIRLLIKFPGMAPLESLLHNETKTFRSLLIMQKFKVIYYTENNFIHISKIWDCRCNPELLKKDME